MVCAVRCGLTSEKLNAGGSSAASLLCECGEIGGSGRFPKNWGKWSLNIPGQE